MHQHLFSRKGFNFFTASKKRHKLYKKSKKLLNSPKFLPWILIQKIHAFVVSKMLLSPRRHERKPLLLKRLHPQQIVEPMAVLSRGAHLRRVAVAVQELARTPVLAKTPREIHARPPPKTGAFLQIRQESRIIDRAAPPVKRVWKWVRTPLVSIREHQRITPPTGAHHGIHRRVIQKRQLAAAVKIET